MDYHAEHIVLVGMIAVQEIVSVDSGLLFLPIVILRGDQLEPAHSFRCRWVCGPFDHYRN